MSETFDHLRLTPSEPLARYLYSTSVLVRQGNGGFAEYMRTADAAAGCGQPASPFDAPWLVFHSWLDGFVELDDDGARTVAELMTGVRSPSPRHSDMTEALAPLGWLADRPVDLEALARRTRTTFVAMQNLRELRYLLEKVQVLKPRTVVEIGTARGGLLYALAQVVDRRATLVSIDLPGANNGGGQFDSERDVFAGFAVPTQHLVCLAGDSHTPAMSEALDEVLDGEAIDLLVIDGDHSYAGVRRDLLEYGPRVRPGGLVALHDICLTPEEWGPNTGVGLFWQELQDRFGNALESVVDPEGVSVRDRPAHMEWSWGFGFLRGTQARSWAVVANGADPG